MVAEGDVLQRLNELRDALLDVQRRLGALEGERRTDLRLQDLREQQTVEWRKEVRSDVEMLLRGQEALRIEMARRDGVSAGGGSGGVSSLVQGSIGIGGGLALLAYVAGKLTGAFQ